MDSEQLLKELARAGLLSEEAGAQARRDASLGGKDVEEMIHEHRLVDDVRLAELKSRILKIPYQRVDAEAITEKILELVPEETAVTYRVAPLKREKNLFIVGMVDPSNAKAQEAMKFIARKHRLNLGIYLITWSDWREVLKKYSPFKAQITEAIKSLNIKSGVKQTVELEASLKNVAEEAPIIRIVAETLRQAILVGASDIHIEPQENRLRVRFRVDGNLREETVLPAELGSAVVSRVKVMANMKIDETRVPQDGRFRSRVFERNIDFRVSTFPTPLGEKVAIRILDPTTGLKNLDQLGLIGENLKRLKRALEKPFGLILVTGPTSSGKTTTIYAILQSLNKENVNLLSIEDPVEYFISGINQSQVKPDIGYDFASGLRQILRQDPDIILVGEIRDDETAGLTIHAALTGHVVLSTLHTNNAVGVIPRLIDMGVGPFLLPPSLNLMMSQRLVSLLCSSCKVPETASPLLEDAIKKALADAPPGLATSYKAPYTVYRAPGCATCRGRGVVGRTAILEFFEMTPNLEAIVNDVTHLTNQNILAEARRQGMITLRQDGVLKALEGLVSLEEVIRETEDV